MEILEAGFFMTWPNPLEPNAVSAASSAFVVHTASRRWFNSSRRRQHTL